MKRNIHEHFTKSRIAFNYRFALRETFSEHFIQFNRTMSIVSQRSFALSDVELFIRRTVFC